MTATEYLGDLPYIPIAEHDDPQNRLDHPILRLLYVYWNGKRGQRIAPARSEIDPVDFRPAIGWVNLIDVSAGIEQFVMRVLGGRTETMFDLRPDFRTPADFDDPGFRAVALQDLGWAVEHGKPLRMFRDLQTPKRRYRYEGLVLPLSDDNQTVNMLLAAGIPPLGG
ncbi:MAG: PAS domain-containing protein [Ferrovibrio sp.]|uniref:PAS domain-containing protein n=1 Tax=Ferrovibrio sp. TaxID=1917215 RepID=UPI0026175FF8|nr:PAS domain-containing protein [Ferrovibrio sp.]MCW0236003.1 PAS domain-containing protein [Ferrovibrio sp.]